MTAAASSLAGIVHTLGAEGRVDTDAVNAALSRLTAVQPWYVRAMVGFGAWLASLMLISSVGSIGFTFDGGFALVGMAFMVGAVFLRHRSDGDFGVQLSLATSLAGQALFVFGVMQVGDWDVPEMIFVMTLLINLVLFGVFPDRIHRVLSVLLVMGSLAVLFYQWHLNAVVPVLGPAATLALVLVESRRARLVSRGYGRFVRPLQSGLMLGAFGYLLLSVVYVLPELGSSFQFYPRPWISTLLLGALLMVVGRSSWKDLLDSAGSAARAALFGFLAVVIGCAWLAPGILLALIVILLGVSSGQRSIAGAGIGFLVVFLVAFFYGIQITMLQKSATLVATGIAVLVARWVLLRVVPGEAGDD